MLSDSANRLFLSLCAASAAIVFVLLQGHVQVDVLDPNTYGSIVEHRCGIAMLLTSLWALTEAVCFCVVEPQGTWHGTSAYSARVLQ